LQGETNVNPENSASRQGWPLQIKVSALVVGGAGVAGARHGLSNYLYFRSVLKQEAISRGKAISATLASALVEMPDSAVGATIASVKKEAGLAYVEVVGPNGAILAHTFEGRAPSQSASQLREAEKIQDLIVDGVAYIDVPAAVIHRGQRPRRPRPRGREYHGAASAEALLVAITLAALVLAAFTPLWCPLRSALRLTSRHHRRRRPQQQVEVTLERARWARAGSRLTLMVRKMKAAQDQRGERDGTSSFCDLQQPWYSRPRGRGRRGRWAPVITAAGTSM